jgi:hypothetical protein
MGKGVRGRAGDHFEDSGRGLGGQRAAGKRTARNWGLSTVFNEMGETSETGETGKSIIIYNLDVTVFRLAQPLDLPSRFAKRYALCA